MSSTTRVAVLGCGDIARAPHLHAWAEEGRAQVTCGVDVDADVARSIVETWSVPRLATDYRGALQDDVDAVDVCLPGRLHIDPVVDSLAAGKQVLVEKPVALMLKHAQQMADAQAGTDLVLMVAENWPYASSTSPPGRRLPAAGSASRSCSSRATTETRASSGLGGRARAAATTPATSSRRGSTC